MLGISKNDIHGAAAGAAGVIFAVSASIPKVDAFNKALGEYAPHGRAFLGGALVGVIEGHGPTSMATVYRGAQGVAGYLGAKQFEKQMPDALSQIPAVLGVAGKTLATAALCGGAVAHFMPKKAAA